MCILLHRLRSDLRAVIALSTGSTFMTIPASATKWIVVYASICLLYSLSSCATISANPFSCALLSIEVFTKGASISGSTVRMSMRISSITLHYIYGKGTKKRYMVPHLMNHVSVYFVLLPRRGLEPPNSRARILRILITPRGNNSLARLKLRKVQKNTFPPNFLLLFCSLCVTC